MAPLITDLRRKLEYLANQELALALGRTDPLDPEPAPFGTPDFIFANASTPIRPRVSEVNGV